MRLSEPEVFNAWLWSGASPSDDPHAADLDTWAELGSPRLRATLVGKSVGDTYSAQLDETAEGSWQRIPLYGLAEQSSNEPRYRTSLWPVLQVDRRYAEIEILDTCAAHLLRRTATLTQWGKALALFDSYNPTSRAGTLGWTAMEGNCARPRGQVRFEIGPLYSKPHQLLDWQSSYRRAHLKDSGPGLAMRLLVGAAAFAIMFYLARRARQTRSI